MRYLKTDDPKCTKAESQGPDLKIDYFCIHMQHFNDILLEFTIINSNICDI